MKKGWNMLYVDVGIVLKNEGAGDGDGHCESKNPALAVCMPWVIDQTSLLRASLYDIDLHQKLLESVRFNLKTVKTRP